MAATRKRKQKQSLKEFKAWLQGVEELQLDDWCPNLEQWKLIRDKINNIVEEKSVVERQTSTQSAQSAQPMYHQPPQLPPMIPPPPPIPSSIPPADIEMTPEARRMLDPSLNGGKVKTPDIDTSDGNVSSPFA